MKPVAVWINMVLGSALVLPVFPQENEITIALTSDVAMEFVWIEPGAFLMGSADSEEGRDPDEAPQYEVTISRGFYIGKYEITQAQWGAVMETDPWVGRGIVAIHPNYPAVTISWDDVQDFISQLNEAASEALYRLPTEAEWEYAARAGTTTRWSFGDDESQLGDYAWYWDNTFGADGPYFHEVGTKQPNPWGLYDVHGHAWEWCQDWDGPYPSGHQLDPAGPSTGSRRVVRSGRFYILAHDVRSAARSSASPDVHSDLMGARLVKTGPQVSNSTTSIPHKAWGQIKDSGR